MTIASAFAEFTEGVSDIDGLPAAEVVVAPGSIGEAERILDLASEHGLKSVVWGGGTHQGIGGRIAPDLVISTSRLDRVVDWQPDDLTVTVEAGVRVADLESRLSERRQSAVLAELPGDSSVGGAMAAGISGWRRARFGPTRDRVLEVDLVTGDGRHIRAGGRVVKNVTGFDLPRLSVGSFGSLGLIARACLKLWPVPAAKATVSGVDAERALQVAYRPAAIVETNGNVNVFLGGTEAEVEGQVAALDGQVTPGWVWEAAPAGAVRWSLRLPPGLVREGVERLPGSWSYQAGIGVGEIRAASTTADGADDLRVWAESAAGALVIVDGPNDLYGVMDPWGTPPDSLGIQSRLVAMFDPCRVLNPGRLPGGL